MPTLNITQILRGIDAGNFDPFLSYLTSLQNSDIEIQNASLKGFVEALLDKKGNATERMTYFRAVIAPYIVQNKTLIPSGVREALMESLKAHLRDLQVRDLAEIDSRRAVIAEAQRASEARITDHMRAVKEAHERARENAEKAEESAQKAREARQKAEQAGREAATIGAFVQNVREVAASLQTINDLERRKQGLRKEITSLNSFADHLRDSQQYSEKAAAGTARPQDVPASYHNNPFNPFNDSGSDDSLDSLRSTSTASMSGSPRDVDAAVNTGSRAIVHGRTAEAEKPPKKKSSGLLAAIGFGKKQEPPKPSK